ncbi:MAG: carbonic anhydrase [Catenulispora sp.]|nr:carbonic anhydrase [Catenulispora sp.]
MTPQSPTATPSSPGVRPRGASEALAELLQGNGRFVAGQPHYGHEIAAAAASSGGQQPYAVVVGCIDSRVPLEAVFDQNFGSICVVRSGAAVLDRAIAGSVEFAVQELGVPLVMVLGHERCGAVAATVQSLRAGRKPRGSLGYLVHEIAPSVLAAGLDEPDVEARALRIHVQRTVELLKIEEGIKDSLTADPPVRVVGAVYDLDTGIVQLI